MNSINVLMVTVDQINDEVVIHKQESIPVGCVSPAFLVRGGGLPNPSGCRPPSRQNPLDAGHVTRDACWEANPLPCGQTDTCENITLPHTASADGKNHSGILTGSYIKFWRFKKYIYDIVSVRF